MTPFAVAPKPLALAFFFLFVAVHIARGEALPAVPKNYCNDYAGVISESVEHALNERLAKFDKDTTNQIVIAIFPKMESSLSLDEYTLRVANLWGVGQRGRDNGVAFFIFIRDHTMRIQVGYGLTGVLTDALSKEILDRDLKPHFERGDFDGGLTAGVNSILKIVGGKKSSGHVIAKP